MKKLDKDKIKEFCLLRYPSRFKKGFRRVQERDGFTEVWAKGGEVLYLSETFMQEFRENT